MTRFLLEWVVTASLLILAVIALRALLGRRISAGLRYALWVVVLVRLLIPLQFFSLPVPAVFPETEREPITTSAAPAATVPALQGEPVGVPAIIAPQPSGVVVNHDATITPSAVTLDVTRLWDVLGWLWLAGAGVMAAAFLISNLVFALRLRRVRVPLGGADCSLPLYLAENLPSPCLFGLVRPGVYVTAEAAQDPAMLRHILAHEHTHLRHGDHVWNVLRSVALAVHWWNPLVWLAVVLSQRDCELACDEGALKRLGDGERIAYGRTLLALITVKPRPGDLLRCATTMTGGQKSVFDRVTRIARAPKRWLWAAVVAVIATALACMCAFGQAAETEPEGETDPEKGASAASDSLDADLAFSIDENGIVEITGTIDGLALQPGTTWQPTGAPANTLVMSYLPFSDDAEVILTAQWQDDHTVWVATREMTAVSGDVSDEGFWVFTVDLTQDGGAVVEMTPMAGMPAQTNSDTELRLHPKSITDKEAVRAARIAAKLLTAAEEYYNNYNSGMDSPMPYPDVLESRRFYSVDLEKSLNLNTFMEEAVEPGFVGPGYEASRYAIVDLDGDGVNELILWLGQEGVGLNYLIFHEIDGTLYGYIGGYKSVRDLKTDGTFYDRYIFSQEWDRQGMGYSRISFTKTGLEFHPFTYELSLPGDLPEADKYIRVVNGETVDAEAYLAAVAAQEAKPGVTWYELLIQDPDAASTQPSVPPSVPSLDPAYALDEYGVSVTVTGLDCEYGWWYSKIHCSTPISGTTLGELDISSPRFLGGEFANAYSSVTAQYSPEEGKLWMSAIENNPGTLGSREFLVDLPTGVVTEREIDLPEWRGKKPVPPDQVLADAAQTLVWLIRGASDFYQASLPAPEEGLLPFAVPMKMMFASGAGAWDTLLTLHPDGSFEGDYHDTDMGDSGPGYQSTQYVCRFHGRFRDITQVTGTSWSLMLEELVLDTGHPIGEEWVETIRTNEGSYNLRYISSEPYGFNTVDDGPLKPGAQFMLYTPEATGYRPTDELYEMRESENYDSVMFQFWSWWPAKHDWGPYGNALGCYGLCNMETGYGFFDLEAWGIG